jgi:hypothetical protein
MVSVEMQNQRLVGLLALSQSQNLTRNNFLTSTLALGTLQKGLDDMNSLYMTIAFGVLINVQPLLEACGVCISRAMAPSFWARRIGWR